ncbi:MAG: amino acid carrier protein [Oscillospiraceae bacterium]
MSEIYRTLFGNYTVILVLFAGIFLTFKTRFFVLKCGGKVAKEIFGLNNKCEKNSDNKTICSFASKNKRKKGVSSFSAMSTSLSGCLGVGNIIGVSSAIMVGGSGAIFWLLVGGIIGMTVKFCEVYLAVRYKTITQDGSCIGGAMYYLEEGANSKILGVIFAVGCILCSFGIGNIAQCSAISNTLFYTIDINKYITATILTIITFSVINGGAKRIITFCTFLMPIMAMFYICGALAVIFFFRSHISQVICDILSQAVGLDAIVGGSVGIAIKSGITKGIFTNEAGLGSASIAHSCADTNDCLKQGYWGIFEVFLDTIVVCSLTALAILLSKSHIGKGTEAMVALGAFQSVFGGFAKIFLSVSISLFAFGSIVSWNLYGRQCLYYIAPKNKVLLSVYNYIFIFVCFAGCMFSEKNALIVADILNAFMLYPNIIGLLILSKEINIDGQRK